MGVFHAGFQITKGYRKFSLIYGTKGIWIFWTSQCRYDLIMRAVKCSQVYFSYRIGGIGAIFGTLRLSTHLDTVWWVWQCWTLIIVKMFTQQVICVDFPLESLSGPPKMFPFQLKQVSSFWIYRPVETVIYYFSSWVTSGCCNCNHYTVGFCY